MLHDNEKDRKEFVKFLMDNGLYWELDSAVSMQRMNDVYWTMKDAKKCQS